METNTNLNVAHTIRNQIGNRAFVMMGTHSFMGSPDSLTFTVGKNTKKVTKVVVHLECTDTYTVEFWNIRGVNCKLLDAVRNVYTDSLHDVISTGTGLYLSL